MTCYLVSYDLSAPSRDYEAVAKHLKSYADWVRPLESVWLIQTTSTVGQIRDALKACTDSDDKILVVKCGPSWATAHISKKVTDWMRTNI